MPADTGIVPRVARRRRAGAAALAGRLGPPALPAGDRTCCAPRRGSARRGSRSSCAATRRAARLRSSSRPRRRPRVAFDGATCDARRPSARPPRRRRGRGGSSPRRPRADRRWLGRARPLGAGAPAWARRMYAALAAGPAGADRPPHRRGRRRRPRRLGLRLAARRRRRRARPRRAPATAPRPAGSPASCSASTSTPPPASTATARRSPGRAAQGDAAGWVAAAARAAGPARRAPHPASAWRDRADYQERAPGDYLANAIAAGADRRSASRPAVRDRRAGWCGEAGDPGSGLDSAAAWAVRPFPQPGLFPAVAPHAAAPRRPQAARFGIVPSEDWPAATTPGPRRPPGAPGASARPRRRAAPARCACSATCAAPPPPPALLPERVDARTGVPRSTTPLAWSHAFAILALRHSGPDRRVAAICSRDGGQAGDDRGLRGDRPRDEGRRRRRALAGDRAPSTRSRTSSSGSAPRSSGTASSCFVLEDERELVGALGMHPTQRRGRALARDVGPARAGAAAAAAGC